MRPLRVLLVGTGAVAQEAIEVFGADCFVAAWCEPAFAASARVTLPVHTALEPLRRLADHYVVALAEPADRLRLAGELERHGFTPAPPLIASTACVSASAQLGPGTMLGHGVQVGPAARVGAHNMLLHHAVFGHDARSGQHVVIGPGAHVAGETVIGDCVTVRANATLAKGIHVGEHALIAQAAACFRSVPARATAIGNPARVLGVTGGPQGRR